MWPHAFGAIYTARSAKIIRQNAIVLPLYQLIILFVLFVGFTAIGIIALTVNFLLLILVSGAVRLGKAREHRLTADTSPS
jgi:hypothetical protein